MNDTPHIKNKENLFTAGWLRLDLLHYVDPAGLIDDGETPAETAVRELLEETGYHGTVTEVSLPGFNSPGMSGEMIYTVSMTVDNTAGRNLQPVSRQEESEDIETFLVRKDKLEGFLHDAAGNGWGIDAKIITYARGLRV